MNDRANGANKWLEKLYHYLDKELEIATPYLYSTSHSLVCGFKSHNPKLYDAYWYHPDHLGSSSFITNTTGEISQHMEYLPFGETLVEEHLNSYNSPFKFNAKEYDAETGNYYYGARYYDPKWSMWLGVDPLAEKYPSWSSYNFSFNNPIRFIDPDGRSPDDVIIKGGESQKAFELLQASVSSELRLSINANGKVTYTQNDPKATLSSDAQQLVNAIDDSSIFVNVLAENTQFTESGNLYIGGAFSGNDVMQHDIVNLVSTTQEVNPNVLGAASKAHGKEGANMLHEVTESYQGALMSQKVGVSSPVAGRQGSVYPGAHTSATPQSGQIFETLYDAKGNVLQMQNGQYPSNVSKVDWWVKDTKGNPVIIQTLQ